MKPVKIGILGLGTVGCGTVSVLARNALEISRRAGREIRIAQASARDLRKKRACPMEGIQLVQDPHEVVRNPEIEVVVELIGGYELARELVLEAIAHGKHVVTANKALLANYGGEIFRAAAKKGVEVGFEASVAGGIPIIKVMREGLIANRIKAVYGIINGTTHGCGCVARHRSGELVLGRPRHLRGGRAGAADAGWRGRVVEVCVKGHAQCLRTRLLDWCACGDRAGRSTVIDLSKDSFARLAPPSRGLVEVSVTW